MDYGAIGVSGDVSGLGASFVSAGDSGVDDITGVQTVLGTFLPTTIAATPGEMDDLFVGPTFDKYFSGAGIMEFRLQRGKRPDEQFQIGVSFEPDMLGGDSPQSHVVTATKADDGTDVSGAFLTGATLSGYTSSVTIRGGDNKTLYRVTFVVTTALGNIYEHSVLVQVLDTI